MTRHFVRNIQPTCNFFVHLVICHGLLILGANCEVFQTDELKGVTIARTKGHLSRSTKHDTWTEKDNYGLFVSSKNGTRRNNVDEKGEKRDLGDSLISIPEPFPVNKFVQEPFLDHRVRYVPQPYPVTHLEYVPKPVAVPVEVPSQVRVQHFHVHKDRKFVPT